MIGLLVGLGVGLGLALVLLALPGSDRRVRRRGRLAQIVEGSGIPRLRVGSVLALSIASSLVIGVLALLVTAVPVAAFIAAVMAACVPWLVLVRRARRRERALRTAWPDAIDGLVSGVRAGLSLPEAVLTLADRGPMALRPSLGSFEREYRATGVFASALTMLQEDLRDPVADRVIAALRIARDIGGTDLGTALRTVSALLREDARTRGEIEARQSWTVNAARLAVAAPWITLVLLCTRPEAARAYSSATGAIILLIAAAVSFIAYRTMLAIGRLPTEERVIA